MMLVIGSRALHHHNLIETKHIEDSDWDFITTFPSEWETFRNKMNGIVVSVDNPGVMAFKCHHNGKETYFETYIAKPFRKTETSDQMLIEYAHRNLEKDNLTGFYWASPEMCLAIKMSHRFKKNSPHFLKTMNTINFLKGHLGIELNDELQEIMEFRQKEILNYGHPKLNQSKSGFFSGDGVDYKYDHDSIHRAIALTDKPAYTYYIKDDAEVMTSKEKFFECPEEIRLAGVYEEVCVLALERSQIPNDFTIDSDKSFRIALEKVCTSITSGWFREFAYDNYNKILAMYSILGNNNYVERFHENFDVVKPFKGEVK